jgi:hypothetical protein
MTSETPKGDYSELINRLFHYPTVIAIVGSGSDETSENGSGIAERFAAELGASTGKRVVVVALNKLLALKTLTPAHQGSYMPGNAPHVWLWPGQEDLKVEFLNSRVDIYQSTWLESLRRHFDCVLLQCPNVGAAPGVTEVAAMADAVIMAVEAGHTSRHQIQQDQRALQLSGARVVGSILLQRR